MNFVTKNLIMMIGPSVLKSIISSVLNEEKLTQYRDEIVIFLRTTADKTKNEIDDGVIELAVKTIMEPGTYIQYTKGLCGLLHRYVSDTKTAWDDMLLIPILDRIEQLGAGEAEVAG